MTENSKNINITFSIIVLLEEVYPNFGQHLMALRKIFKERREPFEIIVVANGLEGFLQKTLYNLGNEVPEITAISLSKRVPQAVCLQSGFKESRGEIIVACGAYQQITDESFNILIDAIQDNVDIVCPWRHKRVDPKINQFQSKLFNYIVRKITGSELHDLSCTVKAFRREVLNGTTLYGNMYRFLPIVAAQKGFRNREVKVGHHQEFGPVGFFGISVYFTRLIDLLTLYFNVHFTRKPLRFFSSIGLLFFIIGFGGFCYVILQKLLLGIPIGGRSVLLLSILLVVIGVQISTVGLLGEIIAFTHGRKQQDYTIERII